MGFFGLKNESEQWARIKNLFWGSLVPIIAISAVAYFSGQTIIQNQAIESLSAQNSAKSAQVDLFIEKLKARAADWSSDGRIQQSAGLISRGEPLTRDLSLYLKNNKLSLDSTVALLDVLDIRGIIIASSDISRLGKDESKEKISFSKAIAASFGEVIFTPELVVEEDELAGVPMLHFASPLISFETRKTIGALLLHIKNDELNKILAVKDGETLETYLVNREKLMITPSRFISNAVLAQSVDTPPVRACLDREKDYRGSHLDYRGEPVFGVSKCLPGGLGVLISEIDESEAFASIYIFRNIVFLALAIILSLTLIYVLRSRKISLLTTTTTSIIISILILIGVVFSLFLSNAIETFVWRAKTEPVSDLIQAQVQMHIADEKYFIDWQSDVSQQGLKDFVSGLKISLPPITAIKIYNKEAILVWSDLVIYKKEIGKKHEVEDVQHALERGQLIKSVEEEIQKQIGSPNLLEIYSPIFLEDKSVQVGVVEVYFDTSDLIDFIWRLQIFIWILIGASLIVIYFLLLFAFRKQNKEIKRQAVDLEKYAKELEQRVSERTKELQAESLRLKDALIEIERKNKSLEDSKAATVNLLEDISTEKTRVENLVLELSKFKLAVENTYDHMIITDTDGVVLYANNAAEKITGYSRNEIIGNKPSLWGRQMSREFYAEMWKTIKTEKKIFLGQFRNKRKNGDIYDVDAQISPIFDASGNLKFFIAIERDITDQKKLDEARNNFISVASHQLRTPLTAIKWTAEILLGGDIGAVTAEQKEFIEDLRISVGRMIDLVNSLLNIARIESNELAVKNELVDFKKITSSLMKDLEPLMRSGQKSVSLDMGEGISEIRADSRLLYEILKNLLTNAIKYSKEKGAVKLSVEKKNEEIIISIRDNGIGIPKNNQGKIFNKFFRADNAVKIHSEGTGLGMYIAKSLADLMGGRIWFESVENAGSTFYLALPVGGIKERAGSKDLAIVEPI